MPSLPSLPSLLCLEKVPKPIRENIYNIDILDYKGPSNAQKALFLDIVSTVEYSSVADSKEAIPESNMEVCQEIVRLLEGNMVKALMMLQYNHVKATPNQRLSTLSFDLYNENLRNHDSSFHRWCSLVTLRFTQAKNITKKAFDFKDILGKPDKHHHHHLTS